MRKLKDTERITSAHLWYKKVDTFYGAMTITMLTIFVKDIETLKVRVIEKELL